MNKLKVFVNFRFCICEHFRLHDDFVCGPAMEAFREATRLFVFEGEEEFSLAFGLFDSHVLNVNLKKVKSLRKLHEIMREIVDLLKNINDYPIVLLNKSVPHNKKCQ